MAQTTVSFSWSSHPRTQSQVLSEKVASNQQNSHYPEEHSTDGTSYDAQNHNFGQTATEKLRHGSKSRKRAVSLKPHAHSIPQTREEIDARLSYAPSRHFNVRTIPPWVRDAEEDDIVDDDDNNESLDSPHRALVAQHNNGPSDLTRKGRQERHITSSGATRPEQTSRWITFARASAYPRENFHGEKVDTQWLNENFTDYSKPWLEAHGDDVENSSSRYRAFQQKRRGWYTHMQFVILRNPFVPLAFRFTVIVFAATAIGLGGSILYDAGIIRACEQQAFNTRSQQCQDVLADNQRDFYRDPSGLMAVIVDIVAIVYTIYITYDEYFSKPLGLRSARAKIRLVLLDLVFIVFQSANLSLSFEALTVSNGACSISAESSEGSRFDRVCDRARALSSVLFVSLVAWLLTFSVSVLRLVERINTR